MKKLVLVFAFSLFSVHLFAIEHVIGISGGFISSKSNVDHTLTASYVNKCYNATPSTEGCNTSNGQQVNTTDPRITNTFFSIGDNFHRNNGYNFNLEYQARMDIFDIHNFLILGLGVENSKTTINPNYLDLDNIDYKINTPYAIATLTLYQQKSVAIRWGFTVGHDFINYSSNTAGNTSANMLVDCEYVLSDHFLLFGRGSTQITKGKDIIINGKNDQVVGNVNSNTNVDILSNKITVHPQESLVKINFGVRYKI
ncbi:MAG: hypothetical protein LBQ34_03595 [Alphaproteobacteria bacterium]|jgi:hypothetical protein|nr:hypothetical protein [Alphaproteobacteria bacterium]